MIQQISTARRNIAGARSLIAAVIAVSAVDLVQGNERERKDAAAYFMGAVYQSHLQWLGLPGDWLPQLASGQMSENVRKLAR